MCLIWDQTFADHLINNNGDLMPGKQIKKDYGRA